MKFWKVFLGKISVSTVIAKTEKDAQAKAEQAMSHSDRNPNNWVVSVRQVV